MSWWNEDPAPKWVRQLAGALMFFGVGVIVGYGLAIVR